MQSIKRIQLGGISPIAEEEALVSWPTQGIGQNGRIE